MASTAPATKSAKAKPAAAPKAAAKKTTAKAPAKKVAPKADDNTRAEDKPAAKKTAQQFRPIGDVRYAELCAMRDAGTLPGKMVEYLRWEDNRRIQLNKDKAAEQEVKDNAPAAPPAAPVDGVPGDVIQDAATKITSAAMNAFGASLGQLTGDQKIPESAKPNNTSRRSNGDEPPQRTTMTGNKIEKDRVTQNGVTRPSKGTTCAAVWDLAQRMSDEQGSTVEFSKLVEAAKQSHINEYTARTQYARWRKFTGVTGRLPKVEKPSAEEGSGK